MKVKDINLKKNLRRKVKITKVVCAEDKDMEGLTGKLTNPFGCFPADGCGIYLDKTGVFNGDICNLNKEDELEFLED